MKLNTVIPYLKKIQYMNRVTHFLISADIRIFHWKLTIFVLSWNTDKDCILIHNFEFFHFFVSLRVVLINVVANLMISPKLATLSLLKMKTF